MAETKIIEHNQPRPRSAQAHAQIGTNPRPGQDRRANPSPRQDRQPPRHHKINRGEGRAMENREDDESYGEQRESTKKIRIKKWKREKEIGQNENERKKINLNRTSQK